MKLFIVFALALATASAVPVENTGRIANGHTAEAGMFPYQVGLSLKSNLFSSSWCGGSVISNEWILTAAHCTEGIKKVTVYLGATRRTVGELSFTVDQSNIFIHPEWDTDAILNDISLIKIPAISFSKYIQPVALPKKSSKYSTYTGEYAIASGWGVMGDSAHSVAETLQWARLQIITNQKCARTYGSSVVTVGNICLSTPGHVSTCEGDSGGPLVLESTGVQIGLTSFGAKAGCEKGYPVVFTRLTEFLPWIESITGIVF